MHLMSVTSTPYGANTQTRPTFACLLSPPDTNLMNNVVTGRHVLADSVPPDETASFNISGDSKLTNLRSSPASQGVFYCELSNPKFTTRVPITISRDDSKYNNIVGQNLYL